MLNKNAKKEHALLIAIFIVFVFLRLFSHSHYFFVSGDQGKYLGAAENFPDNVLFNKQLLLSQRPLYSYLIHFMGLFFEDHIAGMVISLLSAAVTFIIVYKLSIFISGNKQIAFFALILFSISSIFIGMSSNVFKESLSTMLILATIYNYIKFLKLNSFPDMVYSSIFGILSGFASDYSLFLIPSLIVIYCFFKGKTRLWVAAIPLLIVILAYSSWLGVRMITYMSHDYFPAAWDGTVVRTEEWGLRQLISDHYFPEMEKYVPFGISLDPLHYVYPVLYMADLVIAPWPDGLRFSTIGTLFSKEFVLQLLIYLLLFIFAFYSVCSMTFRVIRKKSWHDSVLLTLLLFLIFLVPLHQKIVSTRYTLTSIIFLFILISYGLYEIMRRFRLESAHRNLISLIIVLLLVYLPFYYLNSPYFIFSKEKIVQGHKAAEFLNQLPKDGVMAQIGYTPELAYLSSKRVIALAINPEDMMKIVDMFGINYFVYGESYYIPYSKSADGSRIINYDAIKYLAEHPEQFRLIKVIEETYPWGETDHFYVYELVK